MVLFKDVLDRVSECADPLCRKAAKPVRGEALAFFDCKRFKDMMKETGEDLAADLSVYYKKNVAKSATTEELKKIQQIYFILATNPAEGLKKYGRFVPLLSKVKASDLKKTIGKGSAGGGILPALRLLHPVWKQKDENKDMLARILFIVITRQYENSLDRFHKIAEYAGLEGALFGDVADAKKKIGELGTKLDNKPEIVKLK